MDAPRARLPGGSELARKDEYDLERATLLKKEAKSKQS